MNRLLRAGLLATLLLFTVGSSFAADKIFDEKRDPAKDLSSAEAQAAAEHKNILLDVGGDWCSWCHLLDRTLNENSSLKSTLEKNYVVVHVNWSRENENEPFLSHYPIANGFPYLLVLSADGKLLHAQPTDALEADHKLASGYNQQAILTFLTSWAPRR